MISTGSTSNRRTWSIVAATILCGLMPAGARADVFNMGGTRNADGSWNGLASIEFVTIGDPGNANDDTGYGSVAEPYLIGQFEITNAQWREFLNAKAAYGNPYYIYDPNMSGKYAGGIDRQGSGTLGDPYVYVAKDGDASWDNRPVNYISIDNAIRFCNWLHNGQGDGDMETGAYANVAHITSVTRLPGAKYYIPTDDEWYKAAYYDPNKYGPGLPGYWDYAMMSDTPTLPNNKVLATDPGNSENCVLNDKTLDFPYYSTIVGEFENSASAYGTFDQGGNMYEWNEDAIGIYFHLRGGSWWHSFTLTRSSSTDLSTTAERDRGFRIAAAVPVPEPGSLALLGVGCAAAGWIGWRKRKVRRHGAIVALLAAAASLLCAAPAQADVFNMGGTRNADGSWNGLASIEFVTVGNPGNARDTTNFGGVDHSYQMGKFEITNAQWREFLNAKASLGDPNRLYNSYMAGLAGGIQRSGSGTVEDPYTYTAQFGDANWDNRPVNYINFWDAARFCNWLHNGQGDGDTETGAYANIDDQATFTRLPGAKYFIPTEHEWYKAAFYDPNKNGNGLPGYWDYTTMSDYTMQPSNKIVNPDPGNTANYVIDNYTLGHPYYSTVVGEFENSASAYGTFDQGGNNFEWNETSVGIFRPLRGGSWLNGVAGPSIGGRYLSSPTGSERDYGFRIAAAIPVPEPGSLALLGVSCAAAGWIGWRGRRRERRLDARA